MDIKVDKMKFRFMDPQVIMSVVIALIILAIGIFAFFVTINNIPTETPAHDTTMLENRTHSVIANTSETANSVFNIIGVVLVIGAIMTIIGLVYSYMKPKY